ncbi:MAG: ABC transporter substrate-binding protein [Devosia sp.]
MASTSRSISTDRLELGEKAAALLLGTAACTGDPNSVAEQAKAGDHALQSTLRTLREREMLLRRLAVVSEATGDAALGLFTSHHYSYAHKSEKNQKFVKDFYDTFGKSMRPSYFAITAYDGMAAIAGALQKTGGDVSGDKVMAALKGLQFESPRGPIEIDAATGDIVQTVYIRRTEKVDGELVNVEFDQFDKVKDPAKAAK